MMITDILFIQTCSLLFSSLQLSVACWFAYFVSFLVFVFTRIRDTAWTSTCEQTQNASVSWSKYIHINFYTVIVRK